MPASWAVHLLEDTSMWLPTLYHRNNATDQCYNKNIQYSAHLLQYRANDIDHDPDLGQNHTYLTHPVHSSPDRNHSQNVIAVQHAVKLENFIEIHSCFQDNFVPTVKPLGKIHGFQIQQMEYNPDMDHSLKLICSSISHRLSTEQFSSEFIHNIFSHPVHTLMNEHGLW